MRETGNSPTRKLLHHLESLAGEPFTTRDIIKAMRKASIKPADEGDRKKGGRGRGREAHFDQAKYDLLHDPALVLTDLTLLGAVREEGRKLRATTPIHLRGKISLNPKGLGFVSVRGALPGARDLFIPPGRTGGAFPGDEVEVKLLDRSRDRFEGEVVQIIKRGRELFRLKLLEKPANGIVPGVLLDLPTRLTALLSVSRFPSDTLAKLKPDTIVIVELSGEEVRWKGATIARSTFVRFENEGNLDRDFARILMKYNVDPIYPDDIPLPDESEPIDAEHISDWKKRKDLRNLYAITIDGADSKDFDDAISLEIVKKDLWRLYVHIADVSYYVTPGTPLDREARSRATSWYLANRVVPMLPPQLSENLCSLIAGTNRLAFTAEMEINAKTGAIKKYKIYKSVIRVDHRYTYEAAEAEIDSVEQGGEPNMLSKLWQLAGLQREARIEAGRIDLNIPEAKVKIGKNDQVESIELRPRLKSSMLIEECMLSANIVTAEFLRKKRAPVLYRVHEEMDESKLENLNSFFKIYNIPLELKNTKYKSIQKALSMVESEGDGAAVERIFNLVMLRSFMQANYRPDPFGHWGLGFRDYCHFTSPIRRYPDLVVHRVLGAILDKTRLPYTTAEVQDLGIHTSEQERKAMDGERDMLKLKLIRHIESSGHKRFRGFITGFKPDRVFLELEEVPVEAVVHASHLTNEAELVMPDRFSVYIKKLSRPAFQGEEWELELEKADLEDIRLWFRPIWPKGDGSGRSRSPFRRKRRS